jgi:trigger factor
VEVELGSGRLLPGFEEQLIGAGAGDAREVRIRFPEDWQPASLAGRDAVFAVRVKELKRREVPDLDDEFAKDTGEADTLDELKGKLRAQLEKLAAGRADRDMKETLLKELVARNPTPIAPALVERGIDSQIERARLSLAMQGVDLDRTGVDLRSMRDRLRDGAADEIRGQLLLEAIADQEKIEATDEDVQAEIARTASELNMPLAKVQQQMRGGEARIALSNKIREDKALAFLTSEAKLN